MTAAGTLDGRLSLPGTERAGRPAYEPRENASQFRHGDTRGLRRLHLARSQRDKGLDGDERSSLRASTA